ncbi:hypothetical protein GGX14DRAFT_594289 [Mycena pura]|uniref:Uncharacterized protein n=1 Tax=Mycena pura TaxID=153505 RepID=A0AAD6UUJ5_9AGAR|nr:hypothetical protein GGX14DRAFT_594289 [Mycena pura]
MSQVVSRPLSQVLKPRQAHRLESSSRVKFKSDLDAGACEVLGGRSTREVPNGSPASCVSTLMALMAPATALGPHAPNGPDALLNSFSLFLSPPRKSFSYAKLMRSCAPSARLLSQPSASKPLACPMAKFGGPTIDVDRNEGVEHLAGRSVVVPKWTAFEHVLKKDQETSDNDDIYEIDKAAARLGHVSDSSAVSTMNLLLAAANMCPTNFAHMAAMCLYFGGVDLRAPSIPAWCQDDDDRVCRVGVSRAAAGGHDEEKRRLDGPSGLRSAFGAEGTVSEDKRWGVT